MLDVQPDVRPVRAVAWARVLIAVGSAMAAVFLPSSVDGREALQVLTALVWVPWASALAFAADRAGDRLVRGLGAGSDLLVIFVVSRLVPSFALPALLCYAVALVAASYMADRPFRMGVGVAALLLALANFALTPAARFEPVLAVSFAMVVLAVVLVLDRAALERERATERSIFLTQKAGVILDHVADGVMVTDPLGTVTECNTALARIVGRPKGQLSHRSCAEVLGLREGELALDCSSGCALLPEGGDATPHDAREVWRLRTDGRRQPLLANASPVTGEAGDVVEIVHSLRDVTQLKAADEAKTIFLATASHELKTPLTVIGGFAETLLRRGDLTAEERDAALQAVYRRSLELGRIVDRLLLSSRIEAGRAKLQISEVDVGELVRERVSSAAAAMKRTIELAVPDGRCAALADPEALATVADHLLDNSIKYSPDGQSVHVGVASEEEAVTIVFTDHGIGMDADARGRCFDKFWQAESTDVRRFGGTGIGLYIVRSLVEAMGGRVAVWSEPGRGSRFTVRLLSPASQDREPATDGERSMVREFMRQIGVASGGAS